MPRRGISTVCLLVLGVLAAGTALHAQATNQAKPPMYIYFSGWAVPRAQLPEMAKLGEAQRAVEEKLLADGTITGYGQVINLIHSEGAPTHAHWFTATSEGNIGKALEAFYERPNLTGPVLAASKHWDFFLVSRMYNRQPGTHDGVYLSRSGRRVFSGRPGYPLEGVHPPRMGTGKRLGSGKFPDFTDRVRRFAIARRAPRKKHRPGRGRHCTVFSVGLLPGLPLS
jgi:hypothetical protein